MAKANVVKRYVVLPGTGVVGEGMQAAIFRKGSAQDLTEALKTYFDVGVVGRVPPLPDAAPTRWATADLLEQVQTEFEVVSQRFEDGPAVVAMTAAAKLAFEAAYPDLRVLPLTNYALPGLGRRRRVSVPASAGQPSGQRAFGPGGQLFANDCKKQALQVLALQGPSAGGRDVMVGALDTGIDGTHPALATRLAVSRCLIPGDDPNAGGPVDWGPASAEYASHGTHVAGIIAAEAGHGGPAGVAPAALLCSYRVFPHNAAGPVSAENPVIIDSVRAAIDDGCHIINLSLEGASLKEDGVRSAIYDAWNQGVVCIAAAGNGWGLPVSYPAALPHCVAVTAYGRDGAFPPQTPFTDHVSAMRSAVDPAIFLAKFSNFGPSVQFIAPGHAIVSTFPGGDWWLQSGTSMAAPFVAGVLARLLSDAPQILGMRGNAARSTAMMQLLISRANLLKMPQIAHEGYGLPL